MNLKKAFLKFVKVRDFPEFLQFLKTHSRSMHEPQSPAAEPSLLLSAVECMFTFTYVTSGSGRAGGQMYMLQRGIAPPRRTSGMAFIIIIIITT